MTAHQLQSRQLLPIVVAGMTVAFLLGAPLLGASSNDDEKTKISGPASQALPGVVQLTFSQDLIHRFAMSECAGATVSDSVAGNTASVAAGGSVDWSNDCG